MATNGPTDTAASPPPSLERVEEIASNGAGAAASVSSQGTAGSLPAANGGNGGQAATSTIPPKQPRKAPPRRLRSGSGSGSNSGGRSLGATRERSGSGRSLNADKAASTGIAIGNSLRRRRHVTIGRQSSNEEPSEDEQAELSMKAKPKPAQRVRSLKNVASLVRTNIRNQSLRFKGLENGSLSSDDGGMPTLERRSSSSSFAGVAHQVVTTQRAAKGFLAMWAKDGSSVEHVHKGIHMEKKKLDLKFVASEYKEIKRRQFYQELVVYMFFLLIFFSLLGWLPVQDSYQQNDVVGYLTCREEGVCELKKYGDVYDFASTLTDQLCLRKDVTAQWMRVGGVRFRQVRVKEEQCMIHNGWHDACYPFYSEEVEEKKPITGQDGREYLWHDDLGALQVGSYPTILSSVESYGTGGFTVDLCNVSVDNLQEDEWLSVSTRAFSMEFTLINPVTRVFTIGWHVFTINPSGHMKHYPHSAHLRVIGLEDLLLWDEMYSTMHESVHSPASLWLKVRRVMGIIFNAFDKRILLWLALVLFFGTYCIGELSEMSTIGVRPYLQSDMWNVFELFHLTILASIMVCMVQFYRNSTAFSAHLGLLVDGKSIDTIDQSSVQDLLQSFQKLSDLASLASAISLLKVFKFLRMNSTLNLLWRVLGMAMRDLMGFLVIFNLIFLGYSTMGSYAFGYALEEFSTISMSYGTCFHMLAGEMDYPRLRQANPRLAPVFIVTFIVLVFQILVNMFVAILSEYYESAKNDEGSGEDIEYDVLTRVRNYLKACAPTVVTKKNEVIRLTPHQQVRLISTNLVDQEDTRQRARKLFRGVVWRVVALLRFGVKFDRRIQFGDRKMHNNHGSGSEKTSAVTRIQLSENFDHKTIKEMIPIGITLRLQGDSLLGEGLTFKVVRHNKLSVECVVLGQEEVASLSHRLLRKSSSMDSNAPTRERVLELLGGEKMHIPWKIFAIHVCRSLFKELRMGLMRAMKLWNYSKIQLVDDYHLGLLFDSLREDGRSSLRFDEIYRMLDLYLRKDRKKSLLSQEEVRQETLQVMYRFRKCLIDMPSREKEGHNYRPKPVDTSLVELGPLEHLGDMLARNCHDMWALERLKQGWQYGAQRDDANKKHPNLVPYALLSADEQAFDYRSSVETLKTIVFMNYTVTRVNHSGSFHDGLSRSSSNISDIGDAGSPDEKANDNPSDPSSPKSADGKKPVPALKREAMSFRRNSLMEDSPFYTLYGRDMGEIYKPLPIDTTTIDLPPRLLRLVDLLAENAHEVWAKGRMDEGWTYGPQRDDTARKHPCLVPYIFLTDEEKEYDLNIAKETLKTLLAMKFTLVDRSSKLSA